MYTIYVLLKIAYLGDDSEGVHIRPKLSGKIISFVFDGIVVSMIASCFGRSGK